MENDAASANMQWDNIFDCEFCNFVTPFQRILTRHLKVQHPQHYKIDMGDYVACERCKGFVTITYLDAHQEICGKQPIFQCKFCNKKWSTLRLLKNHMRSVHTNIKEEELETIFDELDETAKIYAFIEGEADNFMTSQGHSPACKENISLQGKVRLHCPKCKVTQQRMLTTNNPVCCYRCNEPFQYECALCSKRYKRHNSARDHVSRKCAPSQQYKCPYCDKIWYVKFTYLKHLKYHEQKIAEDNEGPKVCKNCGITFAKKVGLKVHMWNCNPNRIGSSTVTTTNNWTNVREQTGMHMAEGRYNENGADGGSSSTGNLLQL